MPSATGWEAVEQGARAGAYVRALPRHASPFRWNADGISGGDAARPNLKARRSTRRLLAKKPRSGSLPSTGRHLRGTVGTDRSFPGPRIKFLRPSTTHNLCRLCHRSGRLEPRPNSRCPVDSRSHTSRTRGCRTCPSAGRRVGQSGERAPSEVRGVQRHPRQRRGVASQFGSPRFANPRRRFHSTTQEVVCRRESQEQREMHQWTRYFAERHCRVHAGPNRTMSRFSTIAR